MTKEIHAKRLNEITNFILDAPGEGVEVSPNAMRYLVRKAEDPNFELTLSRLKIIIGNL